MRRRRTASPPLPPPLGGIAIDGANVIANVAARADARLGAAVAWCRQWRADLPVAIFVDHTTAQRCTLTVDHVVAPAGEPADVALLQHAAATASLVISNDRFFAHDALRANAVTLQFTFTRGAFVPVDPATWFRTPGQAVWVPLAALQSAQRIDVEQH
jgi:hypothetical protein